MSFGKLADELNRDAVPTHPDCTYVQAGRTCPWESTPEKPGRWYPAGVKRAAESVRAQRLAS